MLHGPPCPQRRVPASPGQACLDHRHLLCPVNLFIEVRSAPDNLLWPEAVRHLVFVRSFPERALAVLARSILLPAGASNPDSRRQ